MNRIKILMLFVLLISGSAVYGQTHIYERYATHSNLEVAYIEGFALDSTTRVNVTILRAKNVRAWRWMQKEFDIPVLTDREKFIVASGRPLSVVMGRDKNNLREFNKENDSENYTMSISYATHSIVIYHTFSFKDLISIFGYEHRNFKPQNRENT